MSKTIKQLADELGVSKQAISYRLKQLEKEFNRQSLVVKENGILSVTKMAEKLIISAFSENKDRQKENDFLSVQKSTLNELKKQLKEKEEYIKQQQERINFLENQMQEKDILVKELNKRLGETNQMLSDGQFLLRSEQEKYLKLENTLREVTEKIQKKSFDFWKK